nr:BCCT family transporter [Escherichia coli]
MISSSPDHAQPDFSYHSPVCDAFSAGMGSPDVLGVAEPVMHYLSPPVGTPETVAAAAKEANASDPNPLGLHACGQFMPLWRFIWRSSVTVTVCL